MALLVALVSRKKVTGRKQELWGMGGGLWLFKSHERLGLKGALGIVKSYLVTFHMRKMRPRREESPAQAHTTGDWTP